MNMQKRTCKNEHAKGKHERNDHSDFTCPALTDASIIVNVGKHWYLLFRAITNWFLSLGHVQCNCLELILVARTRVQCVWKFASTHDCLEPKYGRFQVSYYSGMMLKVMKNPVKTQNPSMLNVTYWLHISTTYCNPFHLILAQCDLLTAHLHNVLPHCKWNSNICFYATTSRKQG